MPKVSFVCSVYNTKEYLEPFLRSVLGQSYKDFEVVFVDADSKDGTREVLEEYSKKDARIKLIKEGFISIAQAVNLGIKTAQGEYIARVDADNLLFPSFLSDQVEFLDKHADVNFVIADQLKINGDNKVLGMIPFLISDYAMKKHLLFKTAIGGAPMVGRKKAFFDVGLYEETTIISEDRIFALKAMSSKKFASINKINYVYRIHEDAITRRYKKTQKHLAIVKDYEVRYVKADHYCNDLAEYEKIFELDLKNKELIRKKIANTILHCGLRLVDLGKKEEGLAEIEKAMKFYPANKYSYKFFRWQINWGAQDVEDLARKFNFWLPYSIYLMQLVPLKEWKKASVSEVDRKYLEEVLKEYDELLARVGYA